MSYLASSKYNKIALVTGASRGIGRAILEKLVSEGYFVVGTYNKSEIEAQEIQGAFPNQVYFFQIDLVSTQELKKLISKIKLQKFDLVVNNAGIFELENFEKYDSNIWYKTMQVNVNSVFEICLGLQNSIKTGGSIINISSTDGNIGSFAGMAYAASKAALINLSKSLANNLGPKGVRVNCVTPGWINTSMATESSYKATQLTPLKRNGKPQEVAELVAFLASEKASFINGATYTVDGSYSNVDYIMKMEAEESNSFINT